MNKNLTKTFVSILLLLPLLIGCTSTTNQVNVQTVTQDADVVEEDIVEENGQLNSDRGSEYDLAGSTFRVLFLGSDDPPYRDEIRSIQLGVQDAVNYLNESGGVFGANIFLDVQSVDLADEDYINQLLEIIFADDPQLVLMAIPVTEELYEKLNGQSKPVLYFGLGGERLQKKTAGRDNLFWLTPLPDEQMAFTYEVLREQWKTISPSPEIPEMIGAYLTWEGELGNKANSEQLNQYLTDQAIQLSVKDNFAVSPNASVSNALIRSLTANVGLIYTDTFSFGPAAVANDLTSLGMQDFFVLAGSVWCCDVLEPYLYEPPFEGVIFAPRSLAWWDEEANPAIGLANEIAEFGKRDISDLNFGYLLGLGAVDISSEVLKMTVREEGNGEFQARSVYPVLSSLENYVVMDGLFTVDFSNRNRSPNSLQLWKYDPQNGWQAVTDMEKVPELDSTGE